MTYKKLDKKIDLLFKLVRSNHDQTLRNTEAIKWIIKLSGIVLVLIVAILEIARLLR